MQYLAKMAKIVTSMNELLWLNALSEIFQSYHDENGITRLRSLQLLPKSSVTSKWKSRPLTVFPAVTCELHNVTCHSASFLYFGAMINIWRNLMNKALGIMSTSVKKVHLLQTRSIAYTKFIVGRSAVNQGFVTGAVAVSSNPIHAFSPTLSGNF